MYGWTKDKRAAAETPLCLTDVLGSGHHFEFIRLLLTVGHLSFSGKIQVPCLRTSTHFCSPKLKMAARRFSHSTVLHFVVKPLLKLLPERAPVQLYFFVSTHFQGDCAKDERESRARLELWLLFKIEGEVKM